MGGKEGEKKIRYKMFLVFLFLCNQEQCITRQERNLMKYLENSITGTKVIYALRKILLNSWPPVPVPDDTLYINYSCLLQQELATQLSSPFPEGDSRSPCLPTVLPSIVQDLKPVTSVKLANIGPEYASA